MNSSEIKEKIDSLQRTIDKEKTELKELEKSYYKEKCKEFAEPLIGHYVKIVSSIGCIHYAFIERYYELEENSEYYPELLVKDNSHFMIKTENSLVVNIYQCHFYSGYKHISIREVLFDKVTVLTEQQYNVELALIFENFRRSEKIMV